MRSEALERFNEDYLFIRREVLSGRFKVADVKLWMYDRELKIVSAILKERKKFMEKRMAVQSDWDAKELEAMKKLVGDDDE